jgi:hypothetical protein
MGGNKFFTQRNHLLAILPSLDDDDEDVDDLE